jgi:ubiquinone/menaquinone biosynthesis C-methylase UbiE
MQAARQTNEEQIAIWNGAAGRAWVDTQESLDRLFEPFANLLVAEAAARRPRRVLDIGCGTGGTTLAMARELGTSGTGVGLDISEPMIALARSRAEAANAPPRFICADAETYAFQPATFDMIVSRFGVMFFADPVRAFSNLRRAATPEAALEVIAWRSAAENPFMTAAERAAAPYLPQLPARRPDEPGQFAFADARRVRMILEESGWSDIDAQPLDVACTLPTAELEAYVTRLGPVGRVLQDADERTRVLVMDAVRAAFEPYVHGAEVAFTAACWMIRGRARLAANRKAD